MFVKRPSRDNLSWTNERRAITHIVGANLQVEKVFAIRYAQHFRPSEAADSEMATIHNNAGKGDSNEDIDVFQVLKNTEEATFVKFWNFTKNYQNVKSLTRAGCKSYP